MTPDHIQQNGGAITTDSRVRQVQITDIFPLNEPPYGSITNIPILDLAYYPKERGMYNYDTTNTVDSVGQ